MDKQTNCQVIIININLRHFGDWVIPGYISMYFIEHNQINKNTTQQDSPHKKLNCDSCELTFGAI